MDEIYIPKYPRPAILSGRSRETKRNSVNMNFDFSNNNNNSKMNNNNVNFFEIGLLNRKKF